MSEKNKSGRSGKDDIRNPDMNAAEGSDRLEVPEKAVNEAKAKEPLEGRSRAKENTAESAAGSTQSEQTALTGLDRVRQRAKQDKRARFTALLHHLTVDLLRDSFLKLKRNAASGVDGQTWAQYEQNLEGRLADLHGRVHRGSYRAKPSRRIYLEKPDGRKRPLGIAVLEDKIVQRAVVEILNAIYEEDFLGFSYGFRPGCGAHGALDALSVALQFEKVDWVLITGYYRYHAVHGNLPMMARFRHRVQRLWRHALRRRGNKHRPSWKRLTPLFERWLPFATVQHPYPVHRFAVKHPRWEPYAGKPHVRFCPGGVS